MSIFPFRLLSVACALGFLATAAIADCRKVEPVQSVKINAAELTRLSKIGVDRNRLFDALKEVSIPETSGCWAGATGNFDDQIVSVGTLQWNYGQDSLQPIIRRYRGGFATEAGFRENLQRIMPTHGALIFSAGCIATPITNDCRNRLLALQDDNKLNDSIKNEFDALFESDRMIQLQVDRFVALVQSVQDDLNRLFPNKVPTLRQLKWAIDTKVQQGKFPGDADINRLRVAWSKLSANEKKQSMLALVDWYSGLARSADQGGTRLDRQCNLHHWRKLMNENGVDDEQAELLNFAFLKGRTAQGMSGHWQALTFQRRAKIILGVGSVAGYRVGMPSSGNCPST